MIIPNGQLIKNRVTVLGRRGDERIPCAARRRVQRVAYDDPPSRVHRRGRRRRSRTPRSATSPRTRRCIVVCTGFGDSGVALCGALLAARISRTTSGPIRRCGCTSPRRSRAHGMEMPFPHRVLIDAQRCRRGRASRERELAARERGARADRSVRGADRRRAARAGARARRLPVRRRRRHRARRARPPTRCSSSRTAASRSTTTAPEGPVRATTWRRSRRRRISARWGC